MNNRINVGTLVRRAREGAGISRDELARRIGRSLRTVRRLEAEHPDVPVPLDDSMAEALIVALDNPPEAKELRRIAAERGGKPAFRGRWERPQVPGSAKGAIEAKHAHLVREAAPRGPRNSGTKVTRTPERAAEVEESSSPHGFSSVLDQRYGVAPLSPSIAPPASRPEPKAASASPASVGTPSPKVMRPASTSFRRILVSIEINAKGLQGAGGLSPTIWAAGVGMATAGLTQGLEAWVAQTRATALISELAMLGGRDGEDLVRLDPNLRERGEVWLTTSGEIDAVRAMARLLADGWDMDEERVMDALLRGMTAGVHAPHSRP